MTKLPTREECFALLEEHKVPENVMDHILGVNKVAVFLAKKLKEKGIDIDVELVDRASLVHDLDKIKTIGTGNHGKVMYKIVSDKGYEEVARTARNHFVQHMINGIGWEAKIINYSDKRFAGDRIVPLKESFEHIRKNYSQFIDEDYEKGEKAMIEFEKEIFKVIELDPEKLEEYIK